MKPAITLTECPRDAFQALPKQIPTQEKITYLQKLISAGIKRIDFASFVSKKAVPQMADSEDVFQALTFPEDTYLIAIIGNIRGLERLIDCNNNSKKPKKIRAAGYPLSLNETFQKRNLGKTLDQSWDELKNIIPKAHQEKVEIICYLSMAFGNPYNENYNPEEVIAFAKRCFDMGIDALSLADTVGKAEPEDIYQLFKKCSKLFPNETITAHFHSRPDNFKPKVDAALQGGCHFIDSALGGIGGCPFAEDNLTGNLNTLMLTEYLEKQGYQVALSSKSLKLLSHDANRIAQLYGNP